MTITTDTLEQKQPKICLLSASLGLAAVLGWGHPTSKTGSW